MRIRSLMVTARNQVNRAARVGERFYRQKLMTSCLVRDEVHGDFGHKIPEGADAPAGGEEKAALDFPAFGAGEIFEVDDGKEVDVGGIVPVVGEELGAGRAAAPEMGEADAPMAEIGESHDGAASDAQHFAEDVDGGAGFLKSLAENDVVEDFIGVVGEGFLDVALKNGDAAGDGAADHF